MDIHFSNNIFQTHFRTIFVKPENAINIPEKYKKKIEAIQQNDERKLRKKNPIRIKQSSKLVKGTPTTNLDEKEVSFPNIKVKSMIDTRTNICIKFFFSAKEV